MSNAASLIQDARTVKTKFSKTFNTWFFPVGDDIEAIVVDWVRFLPKEQTMDARRSAVPGDQDGNRCVQGLFAATGLTREHWKGTGPVRTIFRDAFKRAGVPYFNPHSFRNTIVPSAAKET